MPNEGCPPSLTCISGQCKDPCFVNNPCASNALCFSDKHKAKCRCPPGLEGDPYINCEIRKCEDDSYCPQDHICLENKCIDPCVHTKCAFGALCIPKGHQGMCKCPAGYQGDPALKCEQTEEPACTRDKECEVGLICSNNQCHDPCISNVCGNNTDCQVVESVPFKSMVCKCLPGYQGDANIQCRQSKNRGHNEFCFFVDILIMK